MKNQNSKIQAAKLAWEKASSDLAKAQNAREIAASAQADRTQFTATEIRKYANAAAQEIIAEYNYDLADLKYSQLLETLD